MHTTLQDSQGFMWFGTEDGLVRYDGQELVRYGYSPKEAQSLPGNFINQIVEDRHHDLWLAINGGLARWNRARDDFTVYPPRPAQSGLAGERHGKHGCDRRAGAGLDRNG